MKNGWKISGEVKTVATSWQKGHKAGYQVQRL